MPENINSDSKIAGTSAGYVIKTHFKGDTENVTGPRCQFRRYVVDVYIENCKAKSGSFRLKEEAEILYYLGHIPLDGIELKVEGENDYRRARGAYPMPKENPDNLPYYGYDIFKTKKMTVNWSSDEEIDATESPKHIARIMMCFSRWGMEYSEISTRTPDEIISADESFRAEIGGEAAKISRNNYLGIVPHDPPQAPPVCQDGIERGSLLSRFAVLADAHVGVRYNWENYEWLYGVFDNLEAIHKTAPLDFVVQLGDNIDDGYANTYATDYAIYLEEIKHLNICDPENPLEPTDKNKIPNYELKGNHDPIPELRFFKDKLWYTENGKGEKVAYISFFSAYGGYPLVNFNIAGNYNAYRSYGKLSEETVNFVDRSIDEAKACGAKHIVLFSHFGISQDVGAPILPESGLGKIANVCKKQNIKLFFNGHEHGKEIVHRMFGDIHDFDVAMLKDQYAIVEIYENVCRVIIYNTSDNQSCKEELVALI